MSEENNKPQEKLSKKENFLMVLKFVFCSTGAGIIQTVSFTLLNELSNRTDIFSFLPEKLINNEYGLFYFVALTLSVLFNFTVNRKFTFKSAANIPIAMLKVFGYYCVFTPASIWWGIALTNIGWNEYLVLAFTMLINLSTEYLFTRFVVYRNSVNTAVKSNENK
ncbi:MAG: GtrA family protein [Clostridia bacterium]|nr:GtrA family protein [Clostridia bacterium]